MWADLSMRGKQAKFLYFPDENHWILQARRHQGLVRDGFRVPGRACARRGVAAPRAALARRKRAAAGSCWSGPPLWHADCHDPSRARQAARPTSRRCSTRSPGATTCSMTSCRLASAGTGVGRGPAGVRRGRGAAVLDIAAGTGTSSHGIHGLPAPGVWPATSRRACCGSAPAGSLPGTRGAGRRRARPAGSASSRATRSRCRSPSATFDVVTISFGLRNVTDPEPPLPRCCGSPSRAAGW